MKHVCTNCGSMRTSGGHYSRAWNALCDQAAGEHGYYCSDCGNIDFDTPDFSEWMNNQPSWIVEKRGDEWRPAPDISAIVEHVQAARKVKEGKDETNRS